MSVSPVCIDLCCTAWLPVRMRSPSDRSIGGAVPSAAPVFDPSHPLDGVLVIYFLS